MTIERPYKTIKSHRLPYKNLIKAVKYKTMLIRKRPHIAVKSDKKNIKHWCFHFEHNFHSLYFYFLSFCDNFCSTWNKFCSRTFFDPLEFFFAFVDSTPRKTKTTRTTHSLILDFAYAYRADWNGQIGSVWLPWKIFLYAVLFRAKKVSEITLWTLVIWKFDT